MNLYKYIDDPNKLDQRGVIYAKLLSILIDFREALQDISLEYDDEDDLSYREVLPSQSDLYSVNYGFTISVLIHNNQMVVRDSQGNTYSYDPPADRDRDIIFFEERLESKVWDIIAQYSDLVPS